MKLSKAHRIMKKMFKGEFCTVDVKTDGSKQGIFTWTVYLDNYHHHDGPSFTAALNKLLLEINPKRVKTQDTEA